MVALFSEVSKQYNSLYVQLCKVICHANFNTMQATDQIAFGTEFLKELEAETGATRKCLERIPEKLFDWKPHERSTNMGYLSLLVAEIPKWIIHIAEGPEIDLATFEHYQPKTTADLVAYFDKNMKGVKKALRDISNEALQEDFFLKTKGVVVLTSSKKDMISSSINHWVHHRGQLTVYMRLNDIPVPSIYGPSADDKGF